MNLINILINFMIIILIVIVIIAIIIIILVIIVHVSRMAEHEEIVGGDYIYHNILRSG